MYRRDIHTGQSKSTLYLIKAALPGRGSGSNHRVTARADRRAGANSRICICPCFRVFCYRQMNRARLSATREPRPRFRATRTGWAARIDRCSLAEVEVERVASEKGLRQQVLTDVVRVGQRLLVRIGKQTRAVAVGDHAAAASLMNRVSASVNVSPPQIVSAAEPTLYSRPRGL